MEKRELVVFDIESTPNSFLVGFKSIVKGKVLQYQAYGEDAKLSDVDIAKIKKILSSYTVIGFNSEKYDIPTLLFAMYGKTCKQIFKVGNEIIENAKPQWMSLRDFGIELPKYLSHIDLIEVAVGVGVGLKAYGARLHSKKLQDLPYEPTSILTPEQFEEVRIYNINDLDTTIDLYLASKDRVDLRFELSELYDVNLMSKSDAQIANLLLDLDIAKQTGSKPKAPKKEKWAIKYKKPDYIKFENPILIDLLHLIENITFGTNKAGNIDLPKELANKKITIGNTTYKIGAGGIHAHFNQRILKPNDDELLLDADVASLYPSIIIQNSFFPEHIGIAFLNVYKNIYNTRLKAKAEVGILKNKIKKLTKDLENCDE